MRLDIDFEPIVYLSIQTDSSWSPRTFLGVGTRVGNEKPSYGKQPIVAIPILRQHIFCLFGPHPPTYQPYQHKYSTERQQK